MKKNILLLATLCTIAISSIAQNPYLPYATTATDSILLLVDRVSMMRYGYQNFCSDNEKKLYTLSVDSFCTFTNNAKDNPTWIENRAYLYPSKVGATNPGIKEYLKVTCRMYADMPELYIWDSYIPRNTDDYTGYYLRISKLYTPSQYASEMAQIDAIVGGILSKITPEMTQYEQLLYLHDTLCQRTSYGGMALAEAGTIKGSILNHKAVCEGWSRGFLYLCQKAGFNCLYITGGMNLKPDEETPSYGNHAWNFVELDGNWYLVDATTDGGLVGATVSHRAFLKGKTYFDQNYRLECAQWDGSLVNENLTAYPTLPTLATDDYVPKTPTSCIEMQKNESLPVVEKELIHGTIYIKVSTDSSFRYYNMYGVELER